MHKNTGVSDRNSSAFTYYSSELNLRHKVSFSELLTLKCLFFLFSIYIKME